MTCLPKLYLEKGFLILFFIDRIYRSVKMERCHKMAFKCNGSDLMMALLMLLHCSCWFQVVDIMRVNVDKVLERDQKISELDDRAG